MYSKLVLGAVIAIASLASLPEAAQAQVVVRVAPPAPRQEVVPAPRRGYAWVPGYWDWRGKRYAWVPGHWERARRGYAYTEPRWVERNGGWVLERGRWGRGDRDRDGVPNRYDRHPDNPRRP